MCLSALPDHLNSQEEIEANFQDDSQFSGAFGRLWKRFKKATKSWFVYGPRDKHWYHRWRELPITLFAWFGPGDSRWEESNGVFAIRALNSPILFYKPHSVFYLSRIQTWCDWHIQIQWPLFLACHFKINKKIVFLYGGFKRDADKVYWLSLFAGLGWK